MTKENQICLGAIVGVHGIRGEVKVKSFTEIAEDIDQYGSLHDKDGKSFQIKVTGHSKELLRVKVKGIDDRNQAEALIGTQLYANRDILPELESEEEFYHADLVGLDVKLQSEAKLIGNVSGIYNFGSGDLLEIKMLDSGKTEVIPFTREYVPELHIKDGYIIIESVALNFVEDDQNEG